jgi:TetR/AcrR family transcriptional repressor of lmrAB and yxaGH operons
MARRQGSTPGPRAAMIDGAISLMRERGVAATSFADVLARSGAPRGSIYHHFPGGKEAISVEVIRREGIRYGTFVGAQLAETDPVDGIPDLFENAGTLLESQDYSEACSIETIALEVASTNEALRLEAAEVFETWLTALAAWFGQLDLADDDCRRLAAITLTALEGAFVLCRTLRSIEPIVHAGHGVQAAVRAAIDRV